MESIFRREQQNPILEADDMPFPAEAVLNPGATEQDGRVVLLLRVEHTNGYSSIYVARSDNGVDGWEIETEPFLAYGQPEWRYERWGCEDPRVVYLADEAAWYVTYTAYSPAGAAVGLARSEDLAEAERIGLIFSPNNKDAALLPEKVNGKWFVVHRPDAGGGIENVWIASSPDLQHWGNPHCILRERSGPAWDAVKVGAGPPPLKTQEGWLLMYHGVKLYAGQHAYRVGVALLDLDQPHRLVGRSPANVFKPTAIYETAGLVPNVLFPTGWLQRDDELWVYYGAADTSVCLARVSLPELLATIEPVQHVET